MPLVSPPPPPPPAPEFCITIVSNSTGYYSRPMRNPRQWLCKVLGDKQGALWSMWKWWIVFFKETIALFGLHLIKINISNEECTRDCFFVEFGRKCPKNKNFLEQNNSSLPASHIFVHFLDAHRSYTMTYNFLMFIETPRHNNTTFSLHFLTWMRSLRIQLQENSSTLCKLSETE